MTRESAKRLGRLGFFAAASLGALGAPGAQQLYDSGSSGRDGALRVEGGERVEVRLPPDGVLHYTTIYVAAGGSLALLPNADNTPAYLLASGDVTVEGTIDAAPFAGPRQVSDLGAPRDLVVVGGVGGPGGHAGGSKGNWGGGPEFRTSAGLGPAGGIGAAGLIVSPLGGASPVYPATPNGACAAELRDAVAPAPAEADWFLLTGGSGGGASRVVNSHTDGGGGGGGVLTVASSGSILITGRITVANVRPLGDSFYGPGGAGALRLIAESILGPAGGLSAVASQHVGDDCSAAGRGFIRLEAFSIESGIALAADVTSLPGPALPFAEGARPVLHIVSVDGRLATQTPAGEHPHFLPGATLAPDTPVVVALEARNVPPGLVPTVIVNSIGAPAVRVQATPLVGDLGRSTSTATIRVPAGVRLGDLQAMIPQMPVARIR